MSHKTYTIRNHTRKRKQVERKKVEMVKNQLYAYTDGSTFRLNPGPISWAVVYVRDNEIETDQRGDQRILAGVNRIGTNTRAELMGVIWALERETSEHLIVRTDSLETIRCVSGMYRRRVNRDLWVQFDKALSHRLSRGLHTDFEYVKGHADDPFNKQADRSAHALAVVCYAETESM